MRATLLCALLVICAPALAAPLPFPKPPRPAAAFEVDFAPMGEGPGAAKEWTVVISVRQPGGQASPAVTVVLKGAAPARKVAGMVRRCSASGCEFSPGRADTAVNVRGVEGNRSEHLQGLV